MACDGRGRLMAGTGSRTIRLIARRPPKPKLLPRVLRRPACLAGIVQTRVAPVARRVVDGDQTAGLLGLGMDLAGTWTFLRAGQDGCLHVLSQTSPSGCWSGWTSLPLGAGLLLVESPPVLARQGSQWALAAVVAPGCGEVAPAVMLYLTPSQRHPGCRAGCAWASRRLGIASCLLTGSLLGELEGTLRLSPHLPDSQCAGPSRTRGGNRPPDLRQLRGWRPLGAPDL